MEEFRVPWTGRRKVSACRFHALRLEHLGTILIKWGFLKRGNEIEAKLFFQWCQCQPARVQKKTLHWPMAKHTGIFFWKSIVVSMQRLCDFASASCMSLVLCLSNDWQRMDIKYRDCTSYHESWRIKIQQSDMEYIYQAIIAVLCFSTPPSSNKAFYNPHEIGWAFCSGYLQGGRESLRNMQISWLVDYKSTVFLCGWIEWRCFLGLSKTVWSRGSFVLRV